MWKRAVRPRVAASVDGDFAIRLEGAAGEDSAYVSETRQTRPDIPDCISLAMSACWMRAAPMAPAARNVEVSQSGVSEAASACGSLLG
jgi:hypothetical protein